MIGTKKRVRAGLPKNYADRVKRFLMLCETHRAIRDGDRVLGIGTGWIHWESIAIGLFYDVEATVFVIWDNRQLEALKQYVGQLEGLIGKEIYMDETRKQRIHRLIEVISKADSFDDLYQSLGFRYVIDEGGTLDKFQEELFDLVYSYNVFQHVDQSIVSKLTQDFYRVLKPGGFSIHVIDLSGMLVHFAGTHNMPEKNYLRYSGEVWRRCFENRVQYFSRIQRPEWLKLFHRAGLELVKEETHSCNINTIKVASVTVVQLQPKPLKTQQNQNFSMFAYRGFVQLD
jgi:SAM-dependent methyltransferase